MALATLTAVEAFVRTLAGIPPALQMAADMYLQEAIDASIWAVPDKALFEALGFNWELVVEMPLYVTLAHKSESGWQSVRNTHSAPASAEWDAKSPEVQALRKTAIKDMRYAYRKNPDLLSRLSSISEEGSNADMIHDLFDLATLGRANTTELVAMHFDLSRLDGLEATAVEMTDLLGHFTFDRRSINASKLFRDQCFELVAHAVSEIYAAGKQVNEKGTARYSGYESAELRKKRNAAKNAELKKLAEEEAKKSQAEKVAEETRKLEEARLAAEAKHLAADKLALGEDELKLAADLASLAEKAKRVAETAATPPGDAKASGK